MAARRAALGATAWATVVLASNLLLLSSKVLLPCFRSRVMRSGISLIKWVQVSSQGNIASDKANASSSNITRWAPITQGAVRARQAAAGCHRVRRGGGKETTATPPCSF
eukprot:658330-Alexandrium_andersonii.AAC.1